MNINLNQPDGVQLKRRGVAKNNYLTPILQMILENLGIKFSLGNITGRQLSKDGLHLEGEAGSGADTAANWFCTVEGDGHGGLQVHVTGSTYNGHPVLDADVPITGVGAEYIVLLPVHSLTFNNGYLILYGDTSQSLDVRTGADPSNLLSSSGSSFVIPVARFQGGVKTNQYLTLPVSARLIDDGNSTGRARMVEK